MIGGLLFRYWDSGRLIAPVPPPTDDLPLGVENSGYPNIRAKWARKAERDAKREAAQEVEHAEVESEQDAVPVPLPVVGRPAVAAPSVAAPVVQARHTALVAPCALARPEPALVDARLVPVPRVMVLPARTHMHAAAPLAVLDADPVFEAEAARRKRNQRAIELALQLMDDE